MNRCKFVIFVAAFVSAFSQSPTTGSGEIVSLETDQYGGIFADGELNNKVSDQLYYVGYTIPTGSTVRSAERRNFFVFDFSKVAPGLGTITAADISLSLTVAGSIYYGDDDGSGPGPKDTIEEFILSYDPSVDPTLLLSLDTDPMTNPGGPTGAGDDMATASDIFPAFGDVFGAVTDPYMFSDSAPSGTPGTGTPNLATEPGEVVMPFTSDGLMVLQEAYDSGSTVIFTGKMVTWSESTEIEMGGGPTDFLESSEAIFFHTLLGTDTDTPPFLDLTFAVPEPSSALYVAVALSVVAPRRRRNNGVEIKT